jgi:hypothetical protein
MSLAMPDSSAPEVPIASIVKEKAELVRDAAASPARLHSGPAHGRRGARKVSIAEFALR